jgi:hypothetical protein
MWNLCKIRIHKTFFQIIEEISELLDLVHSNIIDLKFMQTRGEKNIILFL